MIRRTCLVLSIALALPATAHAAGPSGAVTVDLNGRLRTAGITLAATAPLSAGPRGITLPVAGGDTRVLRHRGTLRLRAGGRSVTLRALRTMVGTPAVSAVVGRRRVTLLHGPRARLTAAGARALAFDRLRPGAVGRLRLNVSLPDDGPAPLRRPAGAVDLSAGEIRWHVRDSFIQYMAAGEGARAGGGATAGPPSVRPGSDAPLVYDFAFAFRDGWLDPDSGRAAVRFRGSVHFGYRAHGIALHASDPEIEIAGKRSRAIFRTRNGKEASRRAILVDLAPGRPRVDGSWREFGEMPGTLPAGASTSVFAGYYLPRDPFGTITLRARVR